MAFDANRKTKIVLTTEGATEAALDTALESPLVNGTDAERLTSARERLITLTKQSHEPHGPYDLGPLPVGYFQDFAGPETSAFDFQSVMHTLYFLNHPV